MPGEPVPVNQLPPFIHVGDWPVIDEHILGQSSKAKTNAEDPRED